MKRSRITPCWQNWSQLQRKNEKVNEVICENSYPFLAILDFQDSDAKINVQYFSFGYSFSSKEMLLDFFLEDFKLINVESLELKNLDKNNQNIFGSGIGNKKSILTKSSVLGLRRSFT